MTDLNSRVNRYLTPPENAFWNWSDDGEAIVWADGNRTIAFRAEIEAILRRHLTKGLPPLGSILLVVAACSDSWNDAWQRLSINIQSEPEASSPSVAVGLTRDYASNLTLERLRQLDRVHNIPAELRTRTAAKAELSAMIFENDCARTTIIVAAAVVDALANGLALEIVRREDTQHFDVQNLWSDLKAVVPGLERFNVEAFKLRLETGLEQHIVPADVEEPLATRMRKLFDRLHSDEEFSGMVRLARNLLAMVHLPRPLVQPDEIPVGGVSDIANRGTLDRLLLSELAADDDTLMMRVAMNEAMYLRRETPPRNPPRSRLLFLDTGLRMWGIRRVMATSVAMSFAAMNDGPVDLRVLRSEGDHFFAADLSTRDGLVEHLKVLDPHAHPGRALGDLPEWTENEEHETDVILVTCDSVLADREFHELLDEFGAPIEFIATVSRTGAFQLLQRTMHGTRLLREARLDVEQLFAPRDKPAVPLIDPDISPELPAILAVRPFPLRLSQNIRPKQTWTVRHHGALAITNDRRLMHWDDPDLGGRQITDQLKSRRLLWNRTHAEHGCTHFVVGNASKPDLQLGIVDLDDGHCELLPLDTSDSHVHTVCEHAGVLFVVHRREVVVCDMSSGERFDATSIPCGFQWSHGRYFRNWHEWKALSFDGIELKFEDVKCITPVQIAMFDVEGVQGPVGIAALDGDGFCLVKDDKLQPLWGEAPTALTPPIDIIRISPDGKRVIAKHLANREDWSMEAVAINVTECFVKPIYGDPYAALNPNIWTAIRPRHYRNRIRAIKAVSYGFLLDTASPYFLSMSYDEEVNRFRIAPTTNRRGTPTQLKPFVPVPGPPGARYKLQMAEWNDGSRVFRDSRGLLHLKSADPKIPEATFVLSDDNLAGWCANGEVWGDAYYTGKTVSSDSGQIHENVLRAFVSGLT